MKHHQAPTVYLAIQFLSVSGNTLKMKASDLLMPITGTIRKLNASFSSQINTIWYCGATFSVIHTSRTWTVKSEKNLTHSACLTQDATKRIRALQAAANTSQSEQENYSQTL